ncbi:MAG: sensor histidine kinase [Phormidesmis sp.]
MHFDQVITKRKDEIISVWMARVRGSRKIESSEGLEYKAVLNSLPALIDAIAHLLSQSEEPVSYELIQGGQEHGEKRAEQGYDAEEIVREYAILRNVLFNVLEEELLASEPLLLLRTARLIDGAVDQVIAICLKRYTEERLRDVNLLYDEMVASNQQLDRLLQNEQTNLSHLAHELKSPLTCIIGYSDLFLRQQNKNVINTTFIEQVLSSGRKLLEIVNDTLEMSLYKSGKVVITPEPLQVCDMIKEVVAVLNALAHQKGLAMDIICEPMAEPIITDKNRLRQIITNILSNAIRYTEAGSIHVHTHTTDNEQLEIAITDTGLGINLDEQERIFEPYFQGQAGQQLPSSTGLGLAIARKMAHLLQGNIHLDSEPNRGSTFTLSLPLRYQSNGIVTTEPVTTEAITTEAITTAPVTTKPITTEAKATKPV